MNVVPALGTKGADWVAERMLPHRRTGDSAVISVHWGSNWDFENPRRREGIRAPADRLRGGRSRARPFLPSREGSGGLPREIDPLWLRRLLNDYEGIQGFEEFRGDLGLMYFARLDSTGGGLLDLQMIPTQIKHFRVNRADPEGSAWLRHTLEREGQGLGTEIRSGAQGTLRWPGILPGRSGVSSLPLGIERVAWFGSPPGYSLGAGVPQAAQNRSFGLRFLPHCEQVRSVSGGGTYACPVGPGP